MLKLSTAAWHVQLFYLAEKIWKLFADSWNESNSLSTDLCTYLRTMFVLAPLALLFNGLFWAVFVYVGFYFPVKTFGIINIGKGLGTVVGLALVAVAALFVFRYLGPRVKSATCFVVERMPAPPPKASKGPTLCDLIWQYVVDAHEKVCVIIKIQDEPTTPSEVSK